MLKGIYTDDKHELENPPIVVNPERKPNKNKRNKIFQGAKDEQIDDSIELSYVSEKLEGGGVNEVDEYSPSNRIVPITVQQNTDKPAVESLEDQAERELYEINESGSRYPN